MLSLKIFFTSRRFFAPAFLYSCFSLVFSTWVTYIPYIADKLHITEGKIGGAIFFMALGSLTMLPISNRLTDLLGVGRQALVGPAFLGYIAELQSLRISFVVLASLISAVLISTMFRK